MSENKAAKLFGEIAEKNVEGLRKLAEEDKAEEMRDNSVKYRLKSIYRKYVKKPKAESVEV